MFWERDRLFTAKNRKSKQERFRNVFRLQRRVSNQNEVDIQMKIDSKPSPKKPILRIKAAFHFRVFHTHVYARKTLNPSTLYIF